MLKAIIFTEASNTIGLGHLRRCEALKDILEKQNFTVTLHVSSSLADLKALNVPMGYDWVVIDSYHLPLAFYEACVLHAKHCIFFDDTLRLCYPDQGIILNGALGALKLPYEGEYLWLGTKYALLRQEFHTLTPNKFISDSIKSVFVSFGGGELAMRYISILQKILSEHYPYLEVNALDPSLNLNAQAVRELMDASCVALSASGGTLNELCVCGVPSMAFCIVPNQRFNFEAWKDLGFSFCDRLPTEEGFEKEFLAAFESLQSHYVRKEYAQKSQDLMQNNHWQKGTFLQWIS